jgi:glycosyltransferase involved in cell wall biosynthesis
LVLYVFYIYQNIGAKSYLPEVTNNKNSLSNYYNSGLLLFGIFINKYISMAYNHISNSIPLISIVMPVYNSENFIHESIEGALGQTYPNIELIVVNDGSTDSTAQKIRYFGDKIVYLQTKNKGVSAARNLAIDKSSGSWIAFCDADDIWFPEKLELQISKMHNYLWSHTDSYYFGSDYDETTKRSELSELEAGYIFKKLTVENTVTTSSVLIKKHVLLEHGKFNERLKALEDWELWLKIAKTYPISYVDKPLLKYRVYPNSTSRKAREMLPLHLQVINSIFKDNDISKYKKKAKIKAYLICSYIAEQGDDYLFSFKCAAKAFFLSPLNKSLIRRVVACLVRLSVNLISKK